MEPLSRNDLHSAVQPPVKTLGKNAMTTLFFPLNWLSVYMLPSELCSSKSGASRPTIASPEADDMNNVTNKQKENLCTYYLVEAIIIALLVSAKCY